MGPGPSKTTSQSSSSAPWAPQQGYLMDAFKAANDTFQKNTTAGGYSGDYIAAPNAAQRDGYQNAIDQGYAGQGAAGGMLTNGQNAQKSGSAATGGALNGLGAIGSRDAMGNDIANARRYMDGLDIPGAVNAGMLDAKRTATEEVLPGILRASAASGGVNSDRAALASGVVARGLGEKQMALDATLRNDAYAKGILASQQGTEQSTKAFTAQGTLGNTQNQQGILSQAYGFDAQKNINDQITGGANGLQGLDQQTLDNLKAKFNGGQDFTYDQLQKLMSIIGGTYGSEANGTSTEKSNPSLLQNIGAGVGIAGSLFCDETLKDTYGPTGTYWRSFPLYLFSYKDDPDSRLHMGPMAQEVELSRPDAVGTIGNIKVILTDRL